MSSDSMGVLFWLGYSRALCGEYVRFGHMMYENDNGLVL